MIIINADDWGGWGSATDAALPYCKAGVITSVSAMVFMEDSWRAAGIAKEMGMDVGLHLNFNQRLTGKCSKAVTEAHERVTRFLRRGKYALLFYHPWLRSDFRTVFQSQYEEFLRLYEFEPSHFNGHQHMHLCSNMILDGVIPCGTMVRRSFSFWRGEKGPINRSYRRWVDGCVARRYGTSDYFFALSQADTWGRMERIINLAESYIVELMVHPEVGIESRALNCEKLREGMSRLVLGNYRMIADFRGSSEEKSAIRLVSLRDKTTKEY